MIAHLTSSTHALPCRTHRTGQERVERAAGERLFKYTFAMSCTSWAERMLNVSIVAMGGPALPQ